MIASPTRPSITNNPLPNHNFRRGPRINCLTIEEEGEEDMFELIYDLPKCLMMTWEKLMGMTSTVGYDIWNEDVTKTPNYPTSTNRRIHFKLQSNYPTSTNLGGRGGWGAREGRHFKPQASYQAPTYGGGGGGETLQTPNELPSTHIRGEKHETNNYEFRWRDKDDKIPNTDGTNKQPNEKRLKKK